MTDRPDERAVATRSCGRSSAEPEARRAHREWILGQVATVLSFFWQADDPEPVRAAAGRLWADMLERFPQEHIEQACMSWLRTQTHRPTPADIIRLCAEARPRAQVLHLPGPAPEPPTPRSAEEVARVNAMLNENGFGDIVKRIERSGEE